MTPGSGPEEAVSRAVVEIDLEVEARRASGDLPVGFEEELDAAFEEFAPRTRGAALALNRSVAIVEESAIIDPQVPVASRRPAGAFTKRVVRAGVGWYVRFFVAQMSRFALAVARALNLVAEDLEHLHKEVSALNPTVPADALPAAVSTERWWSDDAVSALVGVTAPVLCAECRDGYLLASLRQAGIEGYGIGDSVSATELQAAGFDVRPDTVMDHVQSLPHAALGGAVLDGSVQWLGAQACGELVAMLSTRIVPRGVLIVASLTPQAWDRASDPVVADLAAHRPLHPETWSYLLTRNGFANVQRKQGGSDLRNKIGTTAASGSVAENTVIREILDAVFTGPDQYVVTATCGAAR